jgi:hypothetical protein
VSPCIAVVGYRRFGGPSCLHLQGYRGPCCLYLHFALRYKQYGLPKRRYPTATLHDVTSQIWNVHRIGNFKSRKRHAISIAVSCSLTRVFFPVTAEVEEFSISSVMYNVFVFFCVCVADDTDYILCYRNQEAILRPWEPVRVLTRLVTVCL